MYQVTQRKERTGQFLKYNAPTLPEAISKLHQETIELNKHYVYHLASGDDLEYRTEDATEPSIFATAVPPIPVPQPPSAGLPAVLFNPTAWLNTKLAPNAPLHARNADFMAYVTKWLRKTNAWIWSTEWSTPLYTVTDKDPIVPVFDVEPTHAQSPLKALLEKGINFPAGGIVPAGGTDKHCAILNLSTGALYGFWIMQFVNNRWECRAEEYLPGFMQADGTVDQYQGWANGATAACITLPAGLIRKVDWEKFLLDGTVSHAGAMVAPALSSQFVFPARKSDAGDTDPQAFPMGTRFRLPADIVINPAWCPMTKMLVTIGRDYGFFVRDNNGGGGYSFMLEDVRPYKIDEKALWMTLYGWDGIGDLPVWKVVGNKTADGEFPFSKMQVIA